MNFPRLAPTGLNGEAHPAGSSHDHTRMPQMLVPRKQRRADGAYWVVSLGRKYTGASRQRRYFRSRKEAKAFVVQAEEASQNLGREAFVLPLFQTSAPL